MTDNKRWQVRPDGSNWGDFGENDQYGRLNLLDEQAVLAGVAEVRCGRTFCLSLPLDRPGGDYHGLGRRPPQLAPVAGRHGLTCNWRPDASLADVWNDDRVEMHTQASTHWDALAHVGHVFDANGDGTSEIVYYNGYRGGTDIGATENGSGDEHGSCARALGVERLAERCVQGRGVMIDLHDAYGAERRFVGYEDLMTICEARGVVVERGDIVCLHTGLAAALLQWNGAPPQSALEASHSVLDSRDPRLLQWIAESGIVALVADNFAIEGVPAREDAGADCAEPLHELCVFKLGMPLGELWYLSELNDWLRDNRRSRFLLTAPPLRLPGAVAAPVTPVATV